MTGPMTLKLRVRLSATTFKGGEHQDLWDDDHDNP